MKSFKTRRKEAQELAKENMEIFKFKDKNEVMLAEFQKQEQHIVSIL